ncbi:hypothetical protein A2U01_0104085, partial [Trifolium medium]|nr:hypothetical protein [Trifolium medium]
RTKAKESGRKMGPSLGQRVIGGGKNTQGRPGEAVEEYSATAWRGGGIILDISLERRW